MKIVKNLEKFIQKGKDEVTDKQAEEAFRTIIKWIGENPNREGLLETPKRVAKAFKAVVYQISILNLFLNHFDLFSRNVQLVLPLCLHKQI